MLPAELPDEPGLDRDAVVAHLRTMVAGGRMSLDRFEELAGAAYAARTYDELAVIVANTPSPVPMTPSALRRETPLEIEVGHGQAKLDRRWQLGADTTVTVHHGQAIVDLTKAEWDSADVNLDLIVAHGQIVVTVPAGVRVVFDRVAANVVNRLRDDVVLPGAPELRIYTDVGHGQIVLRSPRRGLLTRWRLRRTRRSRRD